MSRFTAINLSGLSPPDIIETLDYEAIVKDMRDDLVARFPLIVGVIDLESEPARKLIEAFAYRDLGLRARIIGFVKATGVGFVLEGENNLIGVEQDLRSELSRFTVSPTRILTAPPLAHTSRCIKPGWGGC